jgi:hypothetical protein
MKRTSIYQDVIFYGNGKFGYVNVDEAKELIAELQKDVEIIEATQQKMRLTLGKSAASDNESKTAPKQVI